MLNKELNIQRKKLPESEHEREKRILRELEGKNIVHYEVLLSAWIQTNMERDKTLVTLSSAAIGLLITILTTVGVGNVWMIVLFIIAICSFIVTIWSSLVIYQLNSKHLENALKGSSEVDTKLEKYDKLSIRAFVIGAIAAMLIGALSAYLNLISKDDKKMLETENNISQVVSKNESFNRVGELNPEKIVQKSINGVENLNPETIEQNKTQSFPQDNNQSQSETNTSSDK